MFGSPFLGNLSSGDEDTACLGTEMMTIPLPHEDSCPEPNDVFTPYIIVYNRCIIGYFNNFKFFYTK